jgi:hypothetical protein
VLASLAGCILVALQGTREPISSPAPAAPREEPTQRVAFFEPEHELTELVDATASLLGIAIECQKRTRRFLYPFNAPPESLVSTPWAFGYAKGAALAALAVSVPFSSLEGAVRECGVD